MKHEDQRNVCWHAALDVVACADATASPAAVEQYAAFIFITFIAFQQDEINQNIFDLIELERSD